MKKLCILAISYNEEEHIKFWIDNHRNFVDEVILVDTGSTDRTVEIAEENAIKIFSYEWKHDFSKAKNFALKCCSIEYNPDWIFFLSPDYWVSNQDMEIIREAIEKDDFDAYRTKLMYHPSDWFDFKNTTIHGEKESGVGQIVLFKNDPSIFYMGKVHETVDSSLTIASKKIGYLEIIRHHDDTNIDKISREIYFAALRTKCDLIELNAMREKLYKKVKDKNLKYDIEVSKKIIGQLVGTEREAEIPFVLNNMPKPPVKLLDVGCNYSSFLLEMDKLGFDAYGIDINDYNVPYSKFVKADVRNIPFPDKEFDVVTCISALEHYGLVETPYHSDIVYDSKAPVTAIMEMARVVKDDGIIILTLPFGYAEGKWLKWIKFYSLDMVKQLIDVAALNIIKKQITAFKDNVWKEISVEEGEKVLTTDKVNCNICLILKKINSKEEL